MTRHRHLTRISIVAAAAVSLLVAACGGSSPHGTPSASHAGGPPSPQVQHQIVRFADCMRSNGVPNFPDPTTDPHAFKQAFITQSPAFHSAATHCQYLMPNSGQTESAAQTHAHTVALLAFAHCLHSHGFPNFPDPSSSGQVTHEMIASAGINLQQPAVIQAADSCLSVTHGAITRAMVARFVAGH